MASTWKHSICHNGTLETACTGMACPMVLFGLTNAKIRAYEGDLYPSWIPFACGYIGSYTLGVFGFFAYGVPLMSGIGVPVAHNALEPAATACGSICLGLYAGKHRSAIRTKYNIHGSQLGDCIIHSLISPCAICQEAYEVETQCQDNNRDGGIYTAVLPHEPFAK